MNKNISDTSGLLNLNSTQLFLPFSEGRDCKLQALAYFLDKRDNEEPSTSTLANKTRRAGAHLKFILVQQQLLLSTGWSCNGKQNGSKLCLLIRRLCGTTNLRAVHRIHTTASQEVHRRHCWGSVKPEG